MERIVVVWLHVLAAAVWVGGLLYATHLVIPALARGERACLGLLVLTGLDNLRRVRFDSPWLMGKLLLVIVLLALAAHRDFALVPRATRAIEQGGAPATALSGLRWLDRLLLVLAIAVIFLGVGISRGR